ncbi:MAG: redoxin domain-containing protein [Gemmataceae bacterium]|nr:redoxin domain-containing protein [Gemmataceae bacterium]
MRRPSSFAVTLVVLGVVVTGCRLAGPPGDASEESVALAAGPRVGEPAPEIAGDDLNGVRRRLSDYRGKVVVVSFWAGW